MSLFLATLCGRRELAAQSPMVVLPGQGHMQGRLVKDTSGLETLGAGGDRVGGILALPLQADPLLLQAQVGCGTVEVHLRAFPQLLRDGNSGGAGIL